MFERYTEKARRVIFFARYEASHYGSPAIESEHILLGLLREHKTLRQWTPKAQSDEIRKWVDEQTVQGPTIATSVDLPLSKSSAVILKAAADEADQLAHRDIRPEHLFLALFAVEDCLAAKLLRQAGTDPENIREKIFQQPEDLLESLERGARLSRPQRPGNPPIEIHGVKRNGEYIRGVVSMIRMYNWHWQKTVWTPRDIVVHRKSGKVSFEMRLARDSENFTAVKQGWKKDRCFLCRWELFESDDEHGTAYTNGRNWLCMECHERFIERDFFSSSQSEMT